MVYKEITDYDAAQELYSAGLLCYSVINPCGGYSPYKNPIPPWWRPTIDRFVSYPVCKYAIHLEE